MTESKKRVRGYCCDCGVPLSGWKTIRCNKCSGLNARKNRDVDIRQYRRNWTLKKKYNMEPHEFDEMWKLCKGKCAICGNDMIRSQQTQGQSLDTVSIDHNHKTKKVRGLLCNRCNKGLGSLRESIEILESAINYLKCHNYEETCNDSKNNGYITH